LNCALDDDPIALRSALWTATDQAYKAALSAYAQKQARSNKCKHPQANDFKQREISIRSEDQLPFKPMSKSWGQFA